MAGSGTAHLRGEDALLSVRDLVVEYPTKGGVVQAVSKVSFDVLPGETLGIVGESGCGKSTTGRAVLRLDRLTSGQITFAGERIEGVGERRMRELRRSIQMIFQDPVASLNPRRSVKDIVVEGLAVARAPASERATVSASVLGQVGLDGDRFADMLPRQLSGGQAQRVAIGRALALHPRLLICDEPVSALDVSVQAQILNLIEELKAEFDLTVVFIAHDLGVVRAVSDDVLVMYLGKVCEFGDSDLVYDQPAHPYTRALLDSVPLTDPERGFTGPALEGDLPSPLSPPTGCRFRTRCPLAEERCAAEEPEIREVRPGQYVACHFPLTSPLAESAAAAAATEVATPVTAPLTETTPDATEPSASELTATTPEATKPPVAEEPPVTEPAATKSVAAEPVAAEPVAGKPAASEPAAAKLTPGEPATATATAAEPTAVESKVAEPVVAGAEPAPATSGTAEPAPAKAAAAPATTAPATTGDEAAAADDQAAGDPPTVESAAGEQTTTEASTKPTTDESVAAETAAVPTPATDDPATVETATTPSGTAAPASTEPPTATATTEQATEAGDPPTVETTVSDDADGSAAGETKKTSGGTTA
ncbi:oligopeptide/dipeptide ABC transporter, ATPase subunit [Parafrankia sp. EAN1pec]|uniref:oligopeptide/dipeptide ABC transporter ATP-binding protein n=1 Tax=Parafrankia sp. (strain EAN1pec) TaxID=298653 RepID=UPI00005426FE|nr:oligopeptide/dipeptide ABC transporter, ATPase subunit [Frankia sp. EAN1pec]